MREGEGSHIRNLLSLSCLIMVLHPPPQPIISSFTLPACVNIEITYPPYTPLNTIIAVFNVIQWSTVIVLPTLQVICTNAMQ